MFSLIRPAKVEGHGGSGGHIHHSQGGKLLQLLRKGRVNRITEVREAEEETRICKEVQMTPRAEKARTVKGTTLGGEKKGGKQPIERCLLRYIKVVSEETKSVFLYL